VDIADRIPVRIGRPLFGAIPIGEATRSCPKRTTRVDYLFKLKKSPLVKKLIHQYHCKAGWGKTHEGFEAFATELKLITWKTARRVVLVRRRLGKSRAQVPDNTCPTSFRWLSLLKTCPPSNTVSW